MRVRKRLGLGVLLAAFCALLILLFTPLLVSKGVRLWCWWKTRGTDATIRIDSVDAPFLRPIILRGVRIQSGPNAAVDIATGELGALNSMLSMGGAQHRRYRTLVQPSFVPAKAQWWIRRTSGSVTARPGACDQRPERIVQAASSARAAQA